MDAVAVESEDLQGTHYRPSVTTGATPLTTETATGIKRIAAFITATRVTSEQSDGTELACSIDVLLNINRQSSRQTVCYTNFDVRSTGSPEPRQSNRKTAGKLRFLSFIMFSYKLRFRFSVISNLAKPASLLQ
jgi:hypothetical protein